MAKNSIQSLETFCLVQTKMYATRNLNLSRHINTYIFLQITELQVSAYDNGHEIIIAQKLRRTTRYNEKS